MLDEPPAKTIESLTAILLACERRNIIRAFSGYAIGKRRDLHDPQILLY